MSRWNYDQVPAKVDFINIEGLGRTKDDYVQRFINELFQAKNFSELAFLATEVAKKLEKIGCFNKVNFVIDTSKGEGATPFGYEVTYVVNESNRFAGGINTMIGSNEGSIILSSRLPNIAGRGERISFEHAFGSHNHRSSHLNFTKPLPQFFSSEAGLSFYQNKNSHKQAGFNVFNRGCLFDFSFGSVEKVKHNMQWEGTWRELEAASRVTSFAIREQSGHSFKSALRHIITVDHRDQPIFPNQGFFLRLAQEYAGVGGDVAYFKNESDVQINVPLPFEMVLQGAFRLGIFRPLDDFPAYNSSDLFYLGGPHSLRGFEMRSLGPRSGSDVLGGKSYWTSGIHLFAPLPFAFGKGSFGDYCRTHLFFNAGNLVGQSLNFNGDEIKTSFKNLIADYKAAYGLGLAIRLGQIARIEINYCWPFRFASSDRIMRGVQLGIGVEFI